MHEKRILILSIALAIAGCARFNTKQTDVSYTETGKPLRAITTRATSSTLFTSKSKLTEFKASQTDKSQGASVGALSQESSGTNTVEALRAIDSILGKIR
jgi:hypothetical protein